MRVFNFPIELMDRKVDMEIEGAIGRVLAIDWRGTVGEGGWSS